ncbi:MAG: hypothetical protein R3C13_05615 [Hyphomonas sp.]|uniref:hypothetical protein n=1 Tax=Hyphomonas sp. TaxID=87 RepID=UPI003529A506
MAALKFRAAGKFVIAALVFGAFVFAIDAGHRIGEIRSANWQAVDGVIGPVRAIRAGRRSRSRRHELSFKAEDGEIQSFTIARSWLTQPDTEQFRRISAYEGEIATAYVLTGSETLAQLVAADGAMLIAPQQVERRMRAERTGAALAGLCLMACLLIIQFGVPFRRR